MDIHQFIKDRFEVKQIAPPPILCWMGSSRHRLLDENVARAMLIELFAQIDAKIGAEVGVDRGAYASLILEKIIGLRLILIDSWVGSRGEEHFQDAQQRLALYNVEFMKMKSMDAVEKIADNSLDFVYIDSQRDFNAVTMDIVEWSKKVRRGGIVSGRGYCNYFDTGVVKAVNAYTYAHNIRRFYITRQMEPNYFWIKP